MSGKLAGRLLAATLLLAVMAVSAGLGSGQASAHVRGKPSFLKIENRYVDYYNVKPSSGSKHDFPQSMDTNYHLPQQTIDFAIDKRLMAVSYDQVDRMQLSWDFGDGGQASGFKAQHAYQLPGTYELRITGMSADGTSRLLEATSMQIFPSSDYKLPDYTMSVNGKEVFNNTAQNDLKAGQVVTLALVRHDDKALQSVEWDFGDGQTATGDSVQHTYSDGFIEAYPVVRVRFDDRFYTDNQVWVRDPDAKQAAVTDPSNAAPPERSNSLTGQLQRKLQQGIDSVFKGGKINLGLALFVLLFAIIAGGLHSLTPGHGKTILATLLAGRSSSRYRDLAILTASITIAHTLVIYVIGFVLLTISTSPSANTMLPYFERASAIVVALLALYLVYVGLRRLRGQPEHHHAHHHAEHHAHHHQTSAETTDAGRSIWSLIVIGAGGGIVPCIDALSLMLLAAGLGHPGFGLVLVVFFSLGLAGTITALGLIVILGKSRIVRGRPQFAANAARFGPLVSGIIILLLAVFTLWPR